MEIKLLNNGLKKATWLSGRGGGPEPEVLPGTEEVSKEVRACCRVECWGASRRCGCLKSETASRSQGQGLEGQVQGKTPKSFF